MDVNMIRLTWGTLACWFIILFLLVAFAAGIKTGRVHCGDPTSVYLRKENPRKFWMLILSLLIFIVLSFAVWKTMVIDATNLYNPLGQEGF